MSFDWKDYLELARQLGESSPDEALYEACLRSAISRAYYAVFMIARTHLEENESFTPDSKRSVHQQVWRRFQSNTDDNRQKIKEDGERLKKDRAKADYQRDYRSQYGAIAKDVTLDILTAEEVIASIESL